MSTEGLEPDDELYIDDAVPIGIDSPVELMPFELMRPAKIEGKVSILGVEQLRDVVDAAESALERHATIAERFRALKYFIDHDAFADVDVLLADDRTT